MQVKAEMDHFAQGLRVLGVLDKVKKHPLLFCPLFTDNDPTLLTIDYLKTQQNQGFGVLIYLNSKYCLQTHSGNFFQWSIVKRVPVHMVWSSRRG